MRERCEDNEKLVKNNDYFAVHKEIKDITKVDYTT